MKTLKPTVLYNVVELYYNSLTKKTRLVATIAYGKPYKVAMFLKRLEDLKNKPKGTIHKPIRQ